MLKQHGLSRVFKNDIGSGVSGPELRLNFLIEIVFTVLGFPITEGNPEGMKKRAVSIASLLPLCLDLILGDKGQILGSPPRLKQILKGFTDDGFPLCPRNLLQSGEFVEILLNQKLAQDTSPLFLRPTPGRPAR